MKCMSFWAVGGGAVYKFLNDPGKNPRQQHNSLLSQDQLSAADEFHREENEKIQDLGEQLGDSTESLDVEPPQGTLENVWACGWEACVGT